MTVIQAEGRSIVKQWTVSPNSPLLLSYGCLPMVTLCYLWLHSVALCYLLLHIVVNWLLTYQKILWTHMDPHGHVTKEGSRDTFIDKTQVYNGGR
jgi:predicted acyltransferase